MHHHCGPCTMGGTPGRVVAQNAVDAGQGAVGDMRGQGGCAGGGKDDIASRQRRMLLSGRRGGDGMEREPQQPARPAARAPATERSLNASSSGRPAALSQMSARGPSTPRPRHLAPPTPPPRRPAHHYAPPANCPRGLARARGLAHWPPSSTCSSCCLRVPTLAATATAALPISSMAQSRLVPLRKLLDADPWA